jgi:hypothetical protein
MEPEASLLLAHNPAIGLYPVQIATNPNYQAPFLMCFCNRSINLYIQSVLFHSRRHTFGQDTFLYISTVTLVDRQCKHTTVGQEFPTF